MNELIRTSRENGYVVMRDVLDTARVRYVETNSGGHGMQNYCVASVCFLISDVAGLSPSDECWDRNKSNR